MHHHLMLYVVLACSTLIYTLGFIAAYSHPRTPSDYPEQSEAEEHGF